jgi:hypothetical protein
MANKPYVGDEGTVIYLDCGTGITDATLTEMHVLKPDQTEVVWPASIYNDTYVRYIILPGDFNIKGKFKIQAYVVTPEGKWLGETFEFTVYDKYKK